MDFFVFLVLNMENNNIIAYLRYNFIKTVEFNATNTDDIEFITQNTLKHYYLNTMQYKKLLNLYKCNKIICSCCKIEDLLYKTQAKINLNELSNLQIKNYEFIYEQGTDEYFIKNEDEKYIFNNPFAFYLLGIIFNESHFFIEVLNFFDDFYEAALNLSLSAKNVNEIKKVKNQKLLKFCYMNAFIIHGTRFYDEKLHELVKNETTSLAAAYFYLSGQISKAVSLYNELFIKGEYEHIEYYISYLATKNNKEMLTVINNRAINKEIKLFVSGCICLVEDKKEGAVILFKNLLKKIKTVNFKCLTYILLSTCASTSEIALSYLYKASECKTFFFTFSIANQFYILKNYKHAQFLLQKIVSNENKENILLRSKNRFRNSECFNVGCCDLANSYKLLGRIYYKHEMYDMAVEEFNRGSKVKHLENCQMASVDNFLYLAELYKKLNKKNLAVEAYEKYLQTAKDGENKDKIIQYLKELRNETSNKEN